MIQSSNPNPKYLLKRNEDICLICLHEDLNMNTHRSIIQNNQMLEIIQMPVHKWTDKRNVKQLYKRILLSIKKKLGIHTTTWMNLKTITLTKRSQIQKTSYYTVLFIWNPLESKSIYRESTLVIALGLGTDYKLQTGAFWGDESILKVDCVEDYPTPMNIPQITIMHTKSGRNSWHVNYTSIKPF